MGVSILHVPAVFMRLAGDGFNALDVQEDGEALFARTLVRYFRRSMTSRWRSVDWTMVVRVLRLGDCLRMQRRNEPMAWLSVNSRYSLREKQSTRQRRR
jgi:hypothetical protein